jgi:hypothetical protein
MASNTAVRNHGKIVNGERSSQSSGCWPKAPQAAPIAPYEMILPA